jgi:hypothetical protein
VGTPRAIEAPRHWESTHIMDAYGQKIGKDGYDLIDSMIFLYWMPVVKVVDRDVEHPYPGGYKLHISVDPDQAGDVAKAILPRLQARKLSHKVIYPVSEYIKINKTKQRGKFITIYAGPFFETRAELVKEIDPMLVAMRAKPGPQSMDRLSNYEKAELRAGSSGLISFVMTDSYRK